MSNDNRVEAACVPCSKDHMITVSALLNEAARMAKNRPISDPEIQNRINAAEEELDVWERFDVSPEKLSMLSDEEKTIIRDTISRARSEIRHSLEASGLRWGTGSVDDLENVAHSASDISNDFKNKITPFYLERIRGGLKASTGQSLAPPTRSVAGSGDTVVSNDNAWLWALLAIGTFAIGIWALSKGIQKEGV